MNESLSYAEALKILGAGPSRLTTFLDTVASIGLSAWAASTTISGGDIGIPLGLYELKGDIADHGRAITLRISEWRNGLSRFDRTERLVAAHSVLVVSSFFDVLDFSSLPIDHGDLKFSAAEQVALATGSSPPDSYAGMIKLLQQERLPVPEAHRPYAVVRGEIRAVYDRLGSQLRKFIEGLAISDYLTESDLRSLKEILNSATDAALSRYDGSYQMLATDNYEFMAWASLSEAHALGAGLEKINSHLQKMSIPHSGARSRIHLIMSYKAALRNPVTGSHQAPDGVILPPLEAAYMNPGCLVAEVGPADRDAPAVDKWWDRQETVPDIEKYIVGYLTSLRATQAPLVVLGEPGSGKSKLTEVLAARLCDSNFLPIRVELREVAAESLISEQIEQAILNGPGEHVYWQDLLAAAEEALPVVLLDGFDELLQAAGSNRYDYLEQVQEFQRKQSDMRRPVAVIVTSRIVVADRVRFPRGSLCLRLRPFTNDQIRRWLQMWNGHNAASLEERGLAPLTHEAVLWHRKLAEQPLLLLMLAIFDATANGLQGDTVSGEAELYQALLMDFALREVRKSPRSRALASHEQNILAEAEVLRLAIAALAMFARSDHLVSALELNRDLSVLFPENPEDGSSAAQRVVGLFYFIHRSEARSSGERVNCYEFMHETFEEFLVAWLAVRALKDLVRARPNIVIASTAYGGRLNDGFLYAVLSFRCLAARTDVIDFLKQLIASMTDSERHQCRRLISDLINDALYAHPDRFCQDYEPVRVPFPHRAAAYSANLITLLILMDDSRVVLSRLFSTEKPVECWHKHTHLWKGMLGSEEWEGLLHTIRAEVIDGEMQLSAEQGSPVLLTRHLRDAPMPVPGTTASDYELSIPATSLVGIALRELNFLGNWHEERIMLDAIPFLRISEGWLLGGAGKNPEVSPAYLLADLDYSRNAGPEQRIALYKRAFRLTESRPAIREQLLLRLREEVRNFPGRDVLDVLLQTFPSEPDDVTYISVVKEFWRTAEDPDHRMHARKAVDALQSAWPDAPWDSLKP